jgi:hypothetical protein
VRVFNNVTGGAILRGMGTETMPEQHIGLEQGLINTGGFVRQLTALIVTGTVKGKVVFSISQKTRKGLFQ